MCPETSALPSACGDALQSPLGSSPILRDLVPVRTIHSDQDASVQQRMRPDRLAIVLPVCPRVFFRLVVPIMISQSTSGRLFSWQHVLPNSTYARLFVTQSSMLSFCEWYVAICVDRLIQSTHDSPSCFSSSSFSGLCAHSSGSGCSSSSLCSSSSFWPL